MDVAEPLQPVVTLPAVGEDRRARLNVIGHERVQRRGRRISQRQRPSPFGSRTSTAMPVSTFLPLARPPASSGSGHRRCRSHPPPPCRLARSRPRRTSTDPWSRCSMAHDGLVGADLERPLRLSAEIPSLPVANSQRALNHTVSRRARPVKDRARSHRTTAAAPGAPEAPIAQPPATIGGRSPRRRSQRAITTTPSSPRQSASVRNQAWNSPTDLG